MRLSIGSRAIVTFLAVAASLTVASAAGSITVNPAPPADDTHIEAPVGTSHGAGDDLHAGRDRVNGAGGEADAMGRVVRRLTAGVAAPAGRHATVRDGHTDSQVPAASRFHLASLAVANGTDQHEIPLLR